MRLPIHAIALAALAALPSLAQAQVTIGSGADGTLGSFGAEGTSTYAQTITAPTGAAVLESFALWMSGSSFTFNAYVFAWDEAGNRAVGSHLFKSGPIDTPVGGALERVLVTTGAVAVTAGEQYALVFSFVNGENAGTGSNSFGWDWSGNGYAGGKGAWYNNGGDVSLLNTSSWDGPWIEGDFQFEASFGATAMPPAVGPVVTTPEPASVALMAMGLAAMAGLARRRRAARTA